MKKLYIFDEHANSAQNGIGTYIADLKKHLRDVVEVSVLSFNDRVKSFTKEVGDGVTYYRFPPFCGGSFLANCETGLAIVRMEVADSADNVFLLNYFLCNELLRVLKEYYPLSKTVFVIHDQIWTEKLLGDWRLMKRIARTPLEELDSSHLSLKCLIRRETEMYGLADMIVTMSGDTLGLLRTVYGLKGDKIAFIPHGKEISCLRFSLRRRGSLKKKLLLAEGDKVILYVGRTTQCKGFQATLSAFEKLSGEFPQVRLVVLGNVGDVSQVKNLCPRSKTRVILAGYVDKKELEQWYSVADVGLIPSYSEQCGYAGIEMLAYGLPIVASDGMGVRRMFKDGYNSVVAKIGNRAKPEVFANNLKRAMAALLGMGEQEMMELRKNARRSYLARYAVSGMRSAYIDLFDKLTGKEEKSDGVVSLPEVAEIKEVAQLVMRCNEMTRRGLLTGRMGVALALMEYAEKRRALPLKDFCFNAIQRCIQGIPDNMEPGFASGLAGIGWAIDYMKWRGMAEVDTVEVCREIDRRLMHYSPLRANDLTLDRGIEGLLLYVNLHLYNSRGKAVFDDSYIAELKAVLENLPNDACDNLKKQAALFGRLINGEQCEPDVSLSQFVGEQRDNGITLQHGLAGKILDSVSACCGE